MVNGITIISSKRKHFTVSQHHVSDTRVTGTVVPYGTTLELKNEELNLKLTRSAF